MAREGPGKGKESREAVRCPSETRLGLEEGPEQRK